jgi:hypothetical protein
MKLKLNLFVSECVQITTSYCRNRHMVDFSCCFTGYFSYAPYIGFPRRQRVIFLIHTFDSFPAQHDQTDAYIGENRYPQLLTVEIIDKRTEKDLMIL